MVLYLNFINGFYFQNTSYDMNTGILIPIVLTFFKSNAILLVVGRDQNQDNRVVENLLFGNERFNINLNYILIHNIHNT